MSKFKPEKVEKNTPTVRPSTGMEPTHLSHHNYNLLLIFRFSSGTYFGKRQQTTSAAQT